ncbi:MAG: exonuclease SbcCD subunit D [Erysipelotrichaceae bacterium]|nr:exonuclease SbcCD subunit D [Erysipelotrichaceae bacterium]
MKLIHLSDLHLGKRLLERSLIEDQEYILKEIMHIIKEEEPDGILIAGDIYDKSIPSAEAVELFDDFLSQLAKEKQEVFIVSGNHDSAERIAFGSSIFKNSGIHISPVYNKTIEAVRYKDADIWLVPFIKPVNVKHFYPDKDISTYGDAFETIISDMNIDKERINILVAHQYVTGAEKGGSEEMSIGGIDNIDASLMMDFDYVALGHIHKKQTIAGKIRYCGTPLKYSFSEISNQNSVTVIEIEKGKLQIREINLEPKRELKEITGTFEEIMSEEYYSKLNLEDYYHVILTDEQDIPDGATKIRAVYKNLLKLDYDNTRTRNQYKISLIDLTEEKSTLELFDDFYEMVNGKKMTKEQTKIMEEAIGKVEA